MEVNMDALAPVAETSCRADVGVTVGLSQAPGSAARSKFCSKFRYYYRKFRYFRNKYCDKIS